jgi:hypothetical protein
MLILNTPSSLTHHYHQSLDSDLKKSPNNGDKVKVQSGESANMFTTVYNICVICIVETLKLLGTAIINKTVEYNNSLAAERVKKQNAAAASPRGKLLPRRSSSKVVYVQSIKVDPAWLLSKQQQVQQRHTRLQSRMGDTSTTSARTPSTSSKSSFSATTYAAAKMAASRRVRHYTFPGCNRASSSQYNSSSRRRSYPSHTPNLEIIREEDEMTMI